MKYLFCIAVFAFIAIAEADIRCPVCHATVVDVAKEADDLSKPSKNLAVWNRSMCANEFFQKGSFICPKDGYAYESKLKHWEFSLHDKDGFAYPLDKGIYSFPLPAKSNIKSDLVYSQEFISLASVEHSLLFWCAADTDYFQRIRAYAKTNHLVLTVEKKDSEAIVTATHKIQTEQGAAANP